VKNWISYGTENVSSTGQTNVARNRQTSALEAGMEHGIQRLAKCPETQKTVEEWKILPSLSLHFDHQQL
jgi:hypothetical protein